MARVVFERRARKRFSQLPQHEKEKVARAIRFLEHEDPRVLNIKKMSLPKGKFFRIRVGNIRIIYEVVDSIIRIAVVDFRGNVY